jgi:hypothetical protein
MTLPVILLPLFVEVLLTFGLLFWLAPLRARDFNSGVAHSDNIALREPNWSKPTMQVAYSFSNQFELPLLFYVLTILVLVTRHATILFIVLAWIFVVFRLLHAYVHVTSNAVRLRGSLYGVAAIALFVMWIVYIVEVLTGT